MSTPQERVRGVGECAQSGRDTGCQKPRLVPRLPVKPSGVELANDDCAATMVTTKVYRMGRVLLATT